MTKDGLVSLPDHVVAPLLRALMTIPRRPDSRLILQKVGYGRPPGWDEKTDYNVVWRGRPIGRVWRYDRYDDPRMKGPWHWNWRYVEGRADMSGSAPALETAMADFRRAWDAAMVDSQSTG